MQGTGSRARLRTVAALLVCILGLALVTSARTATTHKHLARGTAVLTASTGDLGHGAQRTDQHAAVPAAAPSAPVLTRFGTSADSSTSASSRTAPTPQVRGPPGQAAA